MRILFITHYDNMYGANRALYKLIVALKTEYNEEPMLVIPSEGEMTKAMEEIGVPYFVSPVTQWQGVFAEPLSFLRKKIKRKKQVLAEVETLYDLLKSQNIDVIHSNSSVIGCGALLADKLGCRHIWHIREFAKEHFRMKYYFPADVVRKCYENADCLIAISNSLAENYRKKYPGAKITRIYDGVSAENCKQEKTNKGKTKFCCVGYLFPMKKQMELVEAFKAVRDKGYSDFEVYFVGDGKKTYAEKLKRFVKRYGLEQIKFLGYRQDVSDILQQMDVGLIASRYEGFGLVTVEYMLHSLPVIGFNGGGTAEIIEHEKTGYLYHDRKELAEAVIALMKDAELRRNMGDAGRLRAQTFFTAERNASELKRLYEKIRKDNAK